MEAAPNTFSKEQILGCKRYSVSRDALSAILDEDRLYTMVQVEELLINFYNNKEGN